MIKQFWIIRLAQSAPFYLIFRVNFWIGSGIMLSGLLIGSCSYSSMETEDEMRNKFDDRYTTLQQLVEMTRVDSKFEMAAQHTPWYRIYSEEKNDVGFSPSRVNAYLTLMDRAQISHFGSIPQEPLEIEFKTDNQWAGYAYFEQSPIEKNYQTLQQCRNEGNLDTCYVYLRPHWYLFFRSNKNDH